MAITVDDIKKLKELTGIGLTDAKAALVDADGNFDKALEALRTAIRTLDGKQIHAVVAPVASARELGTGHDLNGRDPQLP